MENAENASEDARPDVACSAELGRGPEDALALLSEKLLPCPFCGSTPTPLVRVDESLWSHDDANWYSVTCWECDIRMEECEESDALAERWNQRTPAHRE